MCGIVGYVGKQKALPILIDGLKRLEYRGYDSAGIAVIDSKHHGYTVRRVGKVANLESAIRNPSSAIRNAGLGIAHTRWATHGKPTEANAHPHTDCARSLWVVHNGIIENYKELKRELEKEKHHFRSETDTEILAHLIERAYAGAGHPERSEGSNVNTLNEKRIQIDSSLGASAFAEAMADRQNDEKGGSKNGNHKLLVAVRKALSKVTGTYGIAVVSNAEPDKIIAARNSSPLLLGIGAGETMVASDASAIVGTTRNVVYLKDGEIAEITENGFHIETLGSSGERAKKTKKARRERSRTVSRQPESIEWDVAKIEKGGHAHFMHKEMFEMPDAVLNSIRGRLIVEEGKAKLGGIEPIKEKLRDVERIVIAACGTASYAGLVGKYMFEEYAGISTEVEIASEFRYRKPILDKRTALIAVSQSGETADTLAAVREAKEKGSIAMGIINVVGSTIARETGVGIYTHAGPEICVASTKAFVAQLSILSLLTIFLGRQRQMSLTMGKRIAEELQKVPKLIEKVLAAEAQIKRIARRYKDVEDMMFLGRKYNYPIALEGALKMKELAYVHAEGAPAGEFKHGPLALLDGHFPVFCIAPVDSVYAKTKSNIEEIKARGAPLIIVTTEHNREFESVTKDVIYIPKTLEMLTPLISVVPTYLFAYHVAALRGNDIDKPRNIAKSVTVE